MSPLPIIRLQAIVLMVLGVAAAVLGAVWEAASVALAIAVFGGALWLKYISDLRRTKGLLPPHRDRLDLLVCGDLRVAAGIALAVSVSLIMGDIGPPTNVGTARSVTLALLAVAGCVYVSSLIDWFLIMPRISGQLGARPCRSHLGEEPGVWPKTWRSTTSWWYIHRLLAAAAFRFGLSYSITLLISGFVDLEFGRRLIVVAALGVFAEYSVFGMRAVAREAMHPHLTVGRTVRRLRRDQRYRWQRKIGPFSFGIAREPGSPVSTSPREYVYDVSAEGVQLVPVRSREKLRERNEFERKNLTRVKHKDVDLVEPAKPFAGCEDGRCSKINWYCVENRRCYERK